MTPEYIQRREFREGEVVLMIEAKLSIRKELKFRSHGV